DRDDAVALAGPEHRRGGEHLQGADEVELLDVGEQQDAGRDRHGVSFQATRALWKRWRYAAGPTRSTRRNARRIVSALPKPAAAATASMPSRPLSSRRRACSTRASSTKRAGVQPTSRAKTRAKWRGLIAARRASA